MPTHRVIAFIALAACAGPAQSTQPPEAAPIAEAHVAAPATSAAPDAHSEHVTEVWSLEKLAVGAKLLGNLGKVHRTVTTKSPEAQAFFDQGLALTYGFNHDEAARSFARAAQIDPTCALCFWGAAYTLGPNYNIPMLPDRARAAWQAIRAASDAASAASPVEQALIGALSTRYAGPEYLPPPAMQPLNEAYAEAMREVARRFPDDLDVQVLFAEALMNVNPWKLWADGKPAPGTEEVVRALETVLARAPDHAGANHYYIHAIEASKQPEKGIPAADRLGALVPGAGHTVHMPAHIYQRVGRYEDAAEANRRAIRVDQDYLENVKPLGYYPFYLGHNHGFLAYAASMLGRSKESLEAARESAKVIPRDVVCGMPGMDFFLSEPLLVMVRFGRWDDILAEPAPDPKYQMLSGLYLHAQGMALAAKGGLTKAKEHVEQIRALAQALPPDLPANLNSGKRVLELAAKVVEARVAEQEKRPEAIALWQEAVKVEDGLSYAEPADWFYPTRHYLGAALLDAGRARDAEAVYRADLERNPKNGWALFGLWRALALQKQTKQAKVAEANFREAWKSADVEIQRSAF